MLGTAIRIAAEAFENKKDKGGQPYMLHCLFVMREVSHLGELAMICAVLHDLVEDTKWTFDGLREAGFTDEVIQTLVLLTRKEGQSYDDYIKGISLNRIATYIKIADLKHNSDITRLKGLSKSDFDRLEKYCRSYEYLKSVVVKKV